MFTKFKSFKLQSLSTEKNVIGSKGQLKINQIRYPLKNVNENIGQNCKNKQQNKQTLSSKEINQSEKQNIYYTPVVKTSIQNQNQFSLRNFSTKNKRKVDFFKTQKPKNYSTESSNSCLSLKKNHQILRNSQNSSQKQNIYQSYDFITDYRDSKKIGLKQISTKTSIKQIQAYSSPSKKIGNRLKTKQSTLQIAMKNMLSQLKQVRNQNIQLKNELIQIKSQQFYVLDRSKVKEMVIQLEKQKQIRVKVEKQNTQLKQQNKKLIESYSEVKKQNIRFKRINADMKRTIKNLNEQNKVLKKRAWVNIPKEHTGEQNSSNFSQQQN